MPLSHQLFPVNIEEIFPGIGNDECIFTSFQRKVEGFTPLQIEFGDLHNFALVKRYYNKEIRHYFAIRDKIVEPTYIKDNQVWIKSSDKQKNAVKDCIYYDRFTIKVNYNFAKNAPELILSFDRPAKVYMKPISKFIQEYNDSADIFGNTGTNPTDLLNRVLKVDRREKDKKKVYKITKYDRQYI